MRELVPARLQGEGFVLERFQWLGLLVLLLLGWLLSRLVRSLARRLLRRLSRFERFDVDAQTVRAFERPLGIVFWAWFVASGLGLLDLDAGAERVLGVAARSVVVFAAVWALYELVDVATWKLASKAQTTSSTFDDMLVPLLRRTLKTAVLAVGVLYVASWITGDVWHVLAGLSIGSLAIGFAAKDSIENLFGTFTVLLDRPFGLGEFIRFDGQEGSVEEVGFRSTKLRTPGDTLVTIANSKFIGGTVENFGQRRWRRCQTTLSLTYDTKPDRIEAFCEGVRELIRIHPLTKKSDYHVWLAAFAASSLDVQMVCFFDVPDVATEWRERHRLYLDILRLADGQGVEFAFPTQTVLSGDAVQAPVATKQAPVTREQALHDLERARTFAHGLGQETLARLGPKGNERVRYTSEDPSAAGSLGPKLP